MTLDFCLLCHVHRLCRLSCVGIIELHIVNMSIIGKTFFWWQFTYFFQKNSSTDLTHNEQTLRNGNKTFTGERKSAEWNFNSVVSLCIRYPCHARPWYACFGLISSFRLLLDASWSDGNRTLNNSKESSPEFPHPDDYA